MTEPHTPPLSCGAPEINFPVGNKAFLIEDNLDAFNKVYDKAKGNFQQAIDATPADKLAKRNGWIVRSFEVNEYGSVQVYFGAPRSGFPLGTAGAVSAAAARGVSDQETNR